MKHLILIATVLAASVSVMGQWDSWSRVGGYAEQLKNTSRELADRSSQDILRGFNKTRSDIDNAFLAQQIDSSAGLFLDMTRSKRSVGELRDAASILTELSRRAPSFSTQSYTWRRISTLMDDINRELSTFSGGGGWNPGPQPDPRPVIGRVYWRGRVDDRIQLKIRANFGETTVISGSSFGSGAFNFTSGLPEKNVEVMVTRKKGRGRVTVVQQPSRANNFTAVIEVYDNDSGSKDYELDIYWK